MYAASHEVAQIRNNPLFMAAEHAALANCEIAELSYSASSGSTASSVCEQEEHFSSCIH